MALCGLSLKKKEKWISELVGVGDEFQEIAHPVRHLRQLSSMAATSHTWLLNTLKHG